MIPWLSEPSWTSVSDRIIPSDSTPRSFALPRRVPSGSTAPGSATITAWPAATLGAPHTIVRSSDPLSRTVHTLRRSASGCCDTSSTSPMRKRLPLPSTRGIPTLVTRSTSVPLSASVVASWSASCPGSQYSFSHVTGRASVGHQNCSRNRRSFSNSRRRSGTPCFSIARRSMPRPNAKPCTCSGS